MHDPVTWQDVWLSGLGAALVAAIVAAGVARLTVYWTQSGDRAAAALVESRRSAELLTRQAADLFHAIAEATPGQTLPLHIWHQEVLVQVPVLSDPELGSRVSLLNDDWTTYALWLERQVWAGDWYKRTATGGWTAADDRIARLEEYKRVLGARYAWLGRSLAAHRRGEPLPEPSQLPPLPELPMVPPPAPPNLTQSTHQE